MALEWTIAISEIVGTLAIVVTLVYLAIQSRQTNRALLANSRQATMLADLTYLTSALQYPELAPPIEANPDPRTRKRLLILLSAFVRIREFAWFQYQSGILDDETWQTYLAPLLWTLKKDSVFRAIWDEQSAQLAPEFVRGVNEQLT